MGETARERYLRATKAKEAYAKEHKGGYTNPVDLPDFKYLVLEQDKCQVFRMVGRYFGDDERESSDALLVEKSFIRADDDSIFNCIWHPSKDWPLRVLMRKLAKYTYDKETKTKTYENSGCELLKHFLTNDNSENRYEKGMAPSKHVVVNAIDRMDTWCKDNKHTKLLAWSVNSKGDKTYYDAGITYGLYKNIFDEKCTIIGKHYEDVDFLVRKFSEKKRPSDDTYYLVMFEEEKSAIKKWSELDKVDYYSFINKEEFLNKEELSYERYALDNIPFVSKPTPIGVIMNKMGKFIKAIDKKYDFHLWELFVEWKEKEIKEQGEAQEDSPVVPKKETSNVVTSKAVEEEDSDLPSEVEKPRTKTPLLSKVKGYKFTDDDFGTFSGLASLPENEKAWITSCNADEMEITFNIKADAECSDCKKAIPFDATVCPYCGATY